jgi:hypothetical protein
MTFGGDFTYRYGGGRGPNPFSCQYLPLEVIVTAMAQCGEDGAVWPGKNSIGVRLTIAQLNAWKTAG